MHDTISVVCLLCCNIHMQWFCWLCASRCYKTPLANSSPVPAGLKREMGGVCNACFQGDSSRIQARGMQVSSLYGHQHDVWLQHYGACSLVCAE